MPIPRFALGLQPISHKKILFTTPGKSQTVYANFLIFQYPCYCCCQLT
jgi:hypothetical protein